MDSDIFEVPRMYRERHERGNRQCIEFIVTRASCGRVVSRFDLICGDGRITGDGGQL